MKSNIYTRGQHAKVKRNISALAVMTMLLTLALSIMSIAFASITGENLNIKGSMSAIAQEGVFITKISLGDSNNADTANSKINNYIASTFSSKTVLGNSSDSYITYNVTIHNSNNCDFLFIDLVYDGSNSDCYDNEGIICELIGIEKNTTIVPANGDVSFKVKFCYKDGISSSNNILNSIVNFKFRKALTINFKSNDGSDNTLYSKNVAYGEALPGLVETEIPKYENHVFMGWYDSEEYESGTMYYDKDLNPVIDTYGLEEDTTLYAGWRLTKYTVKYDKNAEDATGSMVNQEFEHDESKSLNENKYARKGYNFLHWNTSSNGSGKNYLDKEVVSNLTENDGEEVILYAIWEPIKYNIVFNKNSDDATGAMDNQILEYGQKASLSDNLYSRPGYIFKHWSLNADDTGVHYKNKAEVQDLSDIDGNSVTLYAIWEENKHSIFYEKRFKELITSSDIPEYIKDGDDLVLNIDISNTSNMYINMGDKRLVPEEDYFIVGKVLTVKNITANTTLGIFSTITAGGLTLETEWINDTTVDVTVNGKSAEITVDGMSKGNSYIRLYNGDVYVGDSATSLYVKEYAQNPMFHKGENVFISYEKISGTAKLVSSFTVKFRDAKTSCSALSTAELIANTPGKTNFYIDQSITRTGILAEDASYISMYSANGNEYENFKFRIFYGVVDE